MNENKFVHISKVTKDDCNGWWFVKNQENTSLIMICHILQSSSIMINSQEQTMNVLLTESGGELDTHISISL